MNIILPAYIININYLSVLSFYQIGKCKYELAWKLACRSISTDKYTSKKNNNNNKDNKDED